VIASSRCISVISSCAVMRSTFHAAVGTGPNEYCKRALHPLAALHL
jgi:hypothetical protein